MLVSPHDEAFYQHVNVALDLLLRRRGHHVSSDVDSSGRVVQAWDVSVPVLGMAGEFMASSFIQGFRRL